MTPNIISGRFDRPGLDRVPGVERIAVMKEIKFRSMLSRKLRDGVTAPCGRSVEHEDAVRCARLQMDKEERDPMCMRCAEALRDRGGKKKGKRARQYR